MEPVQHTSTVASNNKLKRKVVYELETEALRDTKRTKSTISTLDMALASLEASQPILARPRLACCSGCSADAMTDLLAKKKNADKIGGVYYTQQTSGRDVWLKFGARTGKKQIGGDADRTRAIGEMLMQHLASCDIPASWNNDPYTSVQVRLDDDVPMSDDDNDNDDEE